MLIKKIIAISVLSVCGFLIAFHFFQMGFSYQFIKTKPIARIKYGSDLWYLKEYISEMNGHNHDVISIMQATNEAIADSYEYSLKTSDTDPNRAFDRGYGNCASYAAIQVAIMNDLYEEFGYDDRVKAEWHSGKVYFMGIWLGSIHPGLGYHCYPVVKTNNGDIYYPDATFKDVLFDGFVVNKERN